MAFPTRVVYLADYISIYSYVLRVMISYLLPTKEDTKIIRFGAAGTFSVTLRA